MPMTRRIPLPSAGEAAAAVALTTTPSLLADPTLGLPIGCQ